MIGGRLNGDHIGRCGSAAPSPKIWPISACAEFGRARAVGERLQRGDHEAAFGSLTPSSIEKPMIANTFCTAASASACFSTG